MANWTSKEITDSQKIKVEKVEDTNPVLYKKRGDYFVEKRDYVNAEKEYIKAIKFSSNDSKRDNVQKLIAFYYKTCDAKYERKGDALFDKYYEMGIWKTLLDVWCWIGPIILYFAHGFYEEVSLITLLVMSIFVFVGVKRFWPYCLKENIKSNARKRVNLRPILYGVILLVLYSYLTVWVNSIKVSPLIYKIDSKLGVVGYCIMGLVGCIKAFLFSKSFNKNETKGKVIRIISYVAIFVIVCLLISICDQAYMQ